VLYYGAEYLVSGSINTSLVLGVNPVIIGLTVVAFGTSLPELVVCLVAVFRQADDIALGNVVGSNIANIGLVLAAGAAFFTVSIQRRTFARDIPLMLTFSAALLAMSYDGELSRIDGVILIAGLIAFTLYCVKTAGSHMDEVDIEAIEAEKKEHGDGLSKALMITALGIGGVLLGAHFLVESAISIARALHISELVIGMTIVAVGTSLPELATTVVAAYRKKSDIAVGNAIGSNIFNVGFVMGATSIARPIPVGASTWAGEMMVMFAFSLVVIPFAAMGRMGRIPGAAILACYFSFILWQAGVF
ncbi:MAG: calcium/sodium antiporter, partial [Nitrospinota bacterium]|nr:calcium/sodium antiporter [Nitrospinota bacterium]